MSRCLDAAVPRTWLPGLQISDFKRRFWGAGKIERFLGQRFLRQYLGDISLLAGRLGGQGSGVLAVLCGEVTLASGVPAQ